MVRTETKAAVLNSLANIGKGAKREGKDAWAAIAKAVPGTPSVVIAEAYLAVENEEEAAWWDQVEKTIDGEVVRAALGIQSGEVA